MAVVSILAVASIVAQLAIGVFYLLVLATSPDDPGLDGAWTVIKLLIVAIYVLTAGLLVWAWTQWSWLVIAAPIAAWVLLGIGYRIASGVVPNHLNWGP
jgi:hypothetical protein